MKSPIDIDHDTLLDLLLNIRVDAVNDESIDTDPVIAFIHAAMDESYDAGRSAVMKDGAARTVLLEARAHWLDAADKSDGDIGKVIANLIANEFGKWAEAHKAPRHAAVKDAPLPELEDASK